MKGNRDVTQQMMAEPTSESTIGLDLGDRWSRYCVIDYIGPVVKEDRVRTSPEALEATFRVILPSKMVIESRNTLALGEPVAGTFGTPSDRGQCSEGPPDLPRRPQE